MRSDIQTTLADGSVSKQFTCECNVPAGTCPTGSDCMTVKTDTVGDAGNQCGTGVGCIYNKNAGIHGMKAMYRGLTGRNVYLRFQLASTVATDPTCLNGQTWELWPMSQNFGATSDVYTAKWWGNMQDGLPTNGGIQLVGTATKVGSTLSTQWSITIRDIDGVQTYHAVSATNVHSGHNPGLYLGTPATPWVSAWSSGVTEISMMTYSVPWMNPSCGFGACCSFDSTKFKPYLYLGGGSSRCSKTSPVKYDKPPACFDDTDCPNNGTCTNPGNTDTAACS